LSASGTRNASDRRDAFGEIARQPRIEPRIERHIGGALRARQQQGSRAHAEIAAIRPACARIVMIEVKFMRVRKGLRRQLAKFYHGNMQPRDARFA